MLEPISTASEDRGAEEHQEDDTNEEDIKKRRRKKRKRIESAVPDMRELSEEFLETCQKQNGHQLRKILHGEGLTSDASEQLFTTKNRDGYTFLHWACDNNHSHFVRMVMENFSRNIREKLVMIPDRSSRTVLHVACMRGLVDVVRFIMENISSEAISKLVTRQNSYGRSVLHVACEKGQSDIALNILESVDDEVKEKLCMVQDKIGQTVLHIACARGETGFLSVVIENTTSGLRERLIMLQDKSGHTALHVACLKLKNDVINVILESVNGDARMRLLTMKGEDGRTALHEACDVGQAMIVKSLMKGVSDGFLETMSLLQDKEKQTALHVACEAGHLDVVKVLMECLHMDSRNKLVMVPDVDGQTAIHVCCEEGHSDVCRTIMKSVHKDIKRKLVMKQNNSGCTILHRICREGQLGMIKVINDSVSSNVVEQGLLVQDKFGLTALHEACRRGQTEIIKLILESVSTDIAEKWVLQQDSEGRTAIHIACTEGKIAPMTVVIESLSTDVREKLLLMQNRAGRTAFQLACIKGKAEAVRFLIECVGSDAREKMIMQQDLGGHIALYFACNYGHAATVRVIIESVKSFLHTLTDYLQNAIIDACHRGANDVVLTTLEGVHHASESVHYRLLRCQDNDGRNLLHIACNRADTNLANKICSSAQQHKTQRRIQFICHKDNTGKTALHGCCQQGHNQLVQLLLDISAKWNCVSEILPVNDNIGKSAFWYAFEMGNYNNVKSILETAMVAKSATEILFGKDKNKQTIIHRACQNKYDHVRCLERVINVAQDIGVNQHIKLLCEKDAYGRTFLAYIAGADEPVVQFLIKILTDWEVGVVNGTRLGVDSSALDNAGYHHSNDDFAPMDYSSPQWESVRFFSLCRWFLTNTDVDGNTTIQHTPASSAFVLGRFFSPFYELLGSDLSKNEPQSRGTLSPASCTCIPPGTREKENDFRIVDENVKEVHGWCKGIASNTRANNVDILISKSQRPSHFHLLHTEFPLTYYDTGDSRSLLKAIGQSKCLQLIRHPYTKAYMHVCWNSFVRYFFFTYIILHMMQLISLTLFITSHHVAPDSANSSLPVSIVPTDNLFTDVSGYLLFGFASLVLIFEFLQMLAKRRHYWCTPSNYVELIVCFCCLLLSATPLYEPYSSWMHQLGIAALCVAWISGAWIMTKISFGKFQTIGLMFVMLFRVIRKVCIFLPVFAVFILTMALVYNNLIQNQETFSHLGFSIMRTMVMTIGELDFSSIFFPDDPAEVPPFYVLTCLFFVVFLGVMNISVMNLLVGMAVGDISELNMQSEVIAFQSRVDLTMESQAMMSLFKCKQSNQNHVHPVY